MGALDRYRVLVAPGLHGSGEAHWQSRWEHLHPAFERVGQDDWAVPDLPRWAWRLEQHLAQSDRPTLIVAHSFGCLATVHATRHDRFNVAGTLLVAPADPDKFGVPDTLREVRLSYPSIVLASTDDPWMRAVRASWWADAWNSGFVGMGALGHINADSGLGDWPQGWRRFEQLVEMAEALAHPRDSLPAR